jgi:hypothetical protein
MLAHEIRDNSPVQVKEIVRQRIHDLKRGAITKTKYRDGSTIHINHYERENIKEIPGIEDFGTSHAVSHAADMSNSINKCIDAFLGRPLTRGEIEFTKDICAQTTTYPYYPYYNPYYYNQFNLNRNPFFITNPTSMALSTLVNAPLGPPFGQPFLVYIHV